MRLWSLHPSLLDRQGLIACWREALLAQAVLFGATRGYRNHPQLTRFRAEPDPVGAIGAYLAPLADEAAHRGYHFDTTKIIRQAPTMINVNDGQVALERDHLQAKLRNRSPDLPDLPRTPLVHPVFRVVPGPVEPWEHAPAHDQAT